MVAKLELPHCTHVKSWREGQNAPAAVIILHLRIDSQNNSGSSETHFGRVPGLRDDRGVNHKIKNE